MIGYLEGEILEVDSNRLIVNVSGVGYEVFASGTLLAKAKGKLAMHIQTEVREQSITLFGFTSAKEKEFYKLLTSVPGLGPKTAMSVMSMSVTELKDAIFSEDIKKLTSIPGLGKKTAQRLILELKKKLPDSVDEERSHRSLDAEIYDALTRLGYGRKQIDDVLKNIPSEITQVEDVVRFFLKNV